MFSPKTLLFVLCSINYLLYGAAQRSNGSLYIPGVPSVGGLEPGEVVVAELIATDGEKSSYVLLDSIPTVVSGSTSRTTATFTLVSAPTAVLLTAEVDRKLGNNDVKENINTECFITGTGESVCQDVMVDIIDQEKTVTITSLFSETTSAVPVIAEGFISTNSSPTTTATLSNSSSVTTLITNTTSIPTPSDSSPTTSDNILTTVIVTSTLASTTTDSPLTSSASNYLARPLFSVTFAILIMCCLI